MSFAYLKFVMYRPENANPWKAEASSWKEVGPKLKTAEKDSKDDKREALVRELLDLGKK